MLGFNIGNADIVYIIIVYVSSAIPWAYYIGKTTDLAYKYRNKQSNPDSLKIILSKEMAKEWADDIVQKRKRVNEVLTGINASWGYQVNVGDKAAALRAALGNQNDYDQLCGHSQV